jgi:putative membrane protein
MELETFLPPFNTALIVISGLALITGFVFIKRQNKEAHKKSMLTATAFAGFFLIVYVIRWFLLGSKPFEGEGISRTIYLLVLVTHIILAIGIVPMVIITLRRALKGDFEKHKAIARFTFPTWLYVAISGWVVFWMLYYL